MNLLVTSITSAVLLTGISDSYVNETQLDKLLSEQCEMARIGCQSANDAKENEIDTYTLSKPFNTQ